VDVLAIAEGPVSLAVAELAGPLVEDWVDGLARGDNAAAHLDGEPLPVAEVLFTCRPTSVGP